MATKNLTTKLTIQNLTAELKKKFGVVESDISKAFKSLKVNGNTVSFYTSADSTGTAAATLDFPAEYFLDQTKTTLVPEFTWSDTTYPGSTDPNLPNNKPVLVLAVKGSDNSVSYSFLNMEKLMNVYTVKTTDKDTTTNVIINGYELDVAVKISGEAGNSIASKPDGLYVASPKVANATAGNLAGLAADGSLTDSGVAGADVLTADDISDFTTDEITSMLSNSTGA